MSAHVTTKLVPSKAAAGVVCAPAAAAITKLVASSTALQQSTTYRNLAVLEQAGVVRRVQSSDEFARYELAEELTGNHHHHLVCISCGSVEDYTPPVGVERSLANAVGKMTGPSGFRPAAHRLDLLGTCASCTS